MRWFKHIQCFCTTSAFTVTPCAFLSNKLFDDDDEVCIWTIGWPFLHLISRISPPWTESGAFRRGWVRISSRIEIILNSWHRTKRLKMLLLVFFLLLHLLHVANVANLLAFTLFDPFDKNPRLKCQTRRVSRPVLVPRLATRVLRWSRSGKTSHQDRSMAA